MYTVKYYPAINRSKILSELLNKLQNMVLNKRSTYKWSLKSILYETSQIDHYNHRESRFAVVRGRETKKIRE